MKGQHYFGVILFGAVFAIGLVAGLNTAPEYAFSAASSTVNLSSQVIVGNAAPVVSAVNLNNGNDLVLTPNVTTSISVSFTVNDPNGCGEVFFGGNVTTTIYRSAIGAACTANNLNCYITPTSTHNCPSATSTNPSANATATVLIYYFAQATDGSSTFSGDTWNATIVARDVANTSSSASDTPLELLTLTALNVVTSSIDYGTISAGQTSTMKYATTTNAGNSTTTLRLHALSTLTSGGNSISTSSQHYGTSSFSMPAGGTAMTGSAVTVPGFLLANPTSTTAVQQLTYWGLEVPPGTATGTYSGTNVFTSLWQP